MLILAISTYIVVYCIHNILGCFSLNEYTALINNLFINTASSMTYFKKLKIYKIRIKRL